MQDYKNVICIGKTEELLIFQKLQSNINITDNYLEYYHGIQSRGNSKAIVKELALESIPLIQGRDFNKYSIDAEEKYFIFKQENIKS